MQSRYAKLVVKDGSGNFIHLLPQTKVDSTINPNSDTPPSGAAISEWGSSFVTKTGDETISGEKTFVEGPYGVASALSGTSINPAQGTVFTKTITTDTSFTISTISAGKTLVFNLILTNGGSNTVSWPSNVKWANGTPPPLSASGIDVLTFLTPDGGTTWYGMPAIVNAL